MKKIFLPLFTVIGYFLFGQQSTLSIYNYSNYNLVARFGAYGQNSCYPAVLSTPSPGTGAYTVPSSPGGGLPFVVSYDKYSNSNTASVIVNSWWVKTSATNPFTNPLYSSGIFGASSPITLFTDWAYFIFQTKDSAGNSYDDFQLGVTACNGTLNTSQAGTYSYSEWYTVTSGSTTYTIIEVF